MELGLIKNKNKTKTGFGLKHQPVVMLKEKSKVFKFAK